VLDSISHVPVVEHQVVVQVSAAGPLQCGG
jgi:hypothetical protein